MRKRYDRVFKAKIALEAVKSESTLQEIGQKHEVHPNQVALWKKLLVENAEQVFDRTGKEKSVEELERQRDALFKQIGQLQVENDFLKKKHRQLFGTEPKL